MASIPDAAKENNNKLELTQAQLNDLMEATGFTEEEIREMYGESIWTAGININIFWYCHIFHRIFLITFLRWNWNTHQCQNCVVFLEGMQGKFPSSGLTEVEFLSMFDESATDSNDRMFVSPKDIFAITDRDHSGTFFIH